MRHKIYFRDVENDALFSVTLAFYFLLTLMISHLFFLLYIMLFLFLIGKKKILNISSFLVVITSIYIHICDTMPKV